MERGANIRQKREKSGGKYRHCPVLSEMDAQWLLSRLSTVSYLDRKNEQNYKDSNIIYGSHNMPYLLRFILRKSLECAQIWCTQLRKVEDAKINIGPFLKCHAFLWVCFLSISTESDMRERIFNDIGTYFWTWTSRYTIRL